MAQVLKWPKTSSNCYGYLKGFRQNDSYEWTMGNQGRKWNTRENFKMNETDTPELEFKLKIWNEKFTGWPEQ